MVAGQFYTFEQRERQRKLLLEWLIEKGYINYLTKDEIVIYESEVDQKHKKQILSLEVKYESIEPLLWILGLTDRLSSYDNLVREDFHPILDITKIMFMKTWHKRLN